MEDLENPDDRPFQIMVKWEDRKIKLTVLPIWDKVTQESEFTVFLESEQLGIIRRVHDDVIGWEWLLGNLDRERAELIGDQIDKHYL